VGALLLGAGFHAQAEPYLANAQTLAPSEIKWPYYLAHAARLRHEPDLAITRFEEVRRRRPDDRPTLVWLGTLQLERGRPAEAEPLLARALMQDPRDVATRFGLGRAALAMKEPARAVEHLEAALHADPRADALRYALAMAYRQLGDERRAVEQAQLWKDGQVYPADPLMEEIGQMLQTAVSFEVMGTRALDQQRWLEAISFFRKGLAVAPRDATLHQNLGTALFLAGDPAEAEKEFREALRLLPGYARAEFSLGVLYETRDGDTEAIARFRSALASDPSLVDARFALADALRRSGLVEESLEHYRQIFTNDPAASQARFGYAMGLVRLGRFVEARASLEESAKLFDNQPGFAHALARVLSASPDPSARDGARAVTLAGSLRRAHGRSLALDETTAMALAEAGRFPEAVAAQQDLVAQGESAGRTDLLDRLRENLRRYQAGMPCREPWAASDPVHRPGSSALGRL
jgi:tetratricopeptide (TPR) repeat protein